MSIKSIVKGYITGNDSRNWGITKGVLQDRLQSALHDFKTPSKVNHITYYHLESSHQSIARAKRPRRGER